MDKFFQALAALLPTGFAWPRDSNSVLMRVIRGLAGSFSELHDFCAATVKQWQPATTINRLAEWEEATGLPDACFTLPPVLLAPGRYVVSAAEIVSFARASTATYIDGAGIRQTAGVNVARYEGDSLVVEAAATNLATRSDEMDSALWVKSRLGPVVVNAAIGADGLMTLDKLVEDATAGQHRFTRTFVVTSAVTYTCAFDLLAGERTIVRLQYLNGADLVANNVIVINLLTGAFTATDPARTVVKALANGVWRVASTVTMTAIGTNLQPELSLADATGAFTYTGNGVSGIYAGAAQVEAAGFPSSYVPTVAAAVNRSADVVYLFASEEASRNLRKKLLLTRLAGPGLAYPDSSSGCTEAIVAVCAWLGYTATVTYNVPFRCGRDRVGDRLGQLDGVLYVNVALQSTLFRVGTSRVGQRLAEGTMNGGELACYLQRVVPARFQINVIFS